MISVKVLSQVEAKLACLQYPEKTLEKEQPKKG